MGSEWEESWGHFYVRTVLLNHSENIPQGEVKLGKKQQPYEIEIDHLIDFSFSRSDF